MIDLKKTAAAGLFGAMMALCAGPAAAQSQRYYDLQAIYALWGMMDAAANTCWEIADYDPAYMEAGEGWKADNILLRDEVDAALQASGESPALVAEGETMGQSLGDMIRQDDDPKDACKTWLRNVSSGAYHGEVYIAEQLGRLRERDGL